MKNEKPFFGPPLKESVTEKSPYDVAVSRGNVRVRATLTPDGKIRAEVDRKTAEVDGWSEWDGVAGVDVIRQVPHLQKLYQGLETAKKLFLVMREGMRGK